MIPHLGYQTCGFLNISVRFLVSQEACSSGSRACGVGHSRIMLRVKLTRKASATLQRQIAWTAADRSQSSVATQHKESVARITRQAAMHLACMLVRPRKILPNFRRFIRRLASADT